MSVCLLMPTLNEVVGMRAIFPQIPKHLFDQIIVVDGGSNDGTIEYCQEHGIELVMQSRMGMRFAYMDAMKKVKCEYVVTFSPDGNSDPDRLAPLVEALKAKPDMVIVSRYKDDAKSEDDDIVTGFGNWLFTKTVNVLLGAHYTDVMVIYRGYRSAMIKELELDLDKHYSLVEKLFFTRISWEPLLSARAARMGLDISEIPGDEPPRIGGERKLQVIRWGAAYYAQFIIEFFRKLIYGKNKV